MKKLFSLLLASVFVLSFSGAAFAVGEEKLPGEDGYGFTYRFVSPSTIEITSYYGYDAEVTVPSTIDGYTVVGIQSFHTEEEYNDVNVFVRKVVLPDTVTYIADSAFYDDDDWSAKAHSELREIVLPEGLKTIGARAFYNNNYLQKIEIPASVTEVGAAAFASCAELSDVTIKSENTLLHGGAFGEKAGYSVGGFAKNLNDLHHDWLYDDGASDFFIWQGQLLDYKGTSKTPVIPDGVTVIGAAAFWRGDITGVTIPSGVKEIGNQAFYECTSLTSVDIPGSVEVICNSAFSGCTGLKSVTFHEGLKVIGDGGFRRCTALTRLDLPNGLTTLEDCAFYDCENIENFSFPKSLSDMESSSIYTSKWYEGLSDGTELYCGSVFLGCKGDYPAKLTVRAGTKMVRIEDYLEGVKELTLPDGLESLIISDAGGSDCGITKLVVPESVNYINLRRMPNLTDITLPQTAVLDENCFSGCYQIKNLVIPKGNQTLRGVCVGRTAHVVLPDDVLEVRGGISDGSYSDDGGNSNLKSIDLKNVRILDDGVLSNSVVLESVTLPDSLVAIGDGVFSGCMQLRSVKGGKNVRQIGGGAFSGCAMLSDFGDLETNVTRVDSLAFFNTAWFHDRPNGVVYFGKVAYGYKGTMAKDTVLSIKDGTVSVTYEFLAGQTELNPSFDQPNLAGLILPQSCKYVDSYAFAGAKNMKFVDLGGVAYIGREAFNNSGCETIVLPDTVRFVGNNAFSAPKIQAIRLNDGLRVLDEGAFFTYGLGKGVTVPASVTYIGTQALGYCPIDPDNPFGGLTKIDDFVIRGTAGGAAQTYAEHNEFTFETAACTAHEFVSETVEATCRTGGFTRQTCAVCGDVTVSAKTSPVAHKAVACDAIEANCTSPGFTGGTSCAYCGQTLTQPTQTPMLGHDWVVAVEEYEYSAYLGLTRHYCRRCEFKWYDTEGSGHVHDYRYSTVTTMPTCTGRGYTTHFCTCGASYVDSYIDALGHNFVNGICTRCDAKEGEAICDGGDQCPSKPFYDVDTSKWYHLGVDYAIEHGLMNGMDTHTFSPDGTMTRAMLVTVLWRYAGSPTGNGNPFSDVPAGQWYTEAVAWAYTNGVVNGVGEGKFAPNSFITREQMAAILFRYAGMTGVDTSARADLSAFHDQNRVSAYARDAFSWACASGIINGVSSTELSPQGSALRAQVATILMRYIERVVK